MVKALFGQSTWDGGGTDDNINTAANWNLDTNPNFTTDTWTFTGSTRLTPSINAAVSTGGIIFDSSAAAFTITDGAGSITLNGNITNNDTQNQTISESIVLGSSSTMNGASGELTLSGVLSGAAGSNIIIDTSNDVNFSGAGANTYVGTTTINDGFLRLDKTAGVTAISGDADVNLVDVTIGDGVGATGTARLVINASNLVDDNVAIDTNSDGTLLVGAAVVDTIGSFNGSGRIFFNGSGAGISIGNNGIDTTASGQINGTGTLTKVGSGTLTLSGNNSYSGVTAVNGGALVINGNNTGTGNVTVASNSALYGTGVISGDVTSLVGSLSAGNGANAVGTLTLAGTNADLGGGTYVWDISDLSAAEGVGYDILEFTAAYDLSNLSGNVLNISITDLNNYIGPNGGTAGNTYKIMNNVTNFSASYFNLDSNLINTVWSISESGGALYLSYEVVPEPSTWFMIFVLSSGLILKIYTKRFRRTRINGLG